jgi:hypothetical protein
VALSLDETKKRGYSNSNNNGQGKKENRSRPARQAEMVEAKEVQQELKMESVVDTEVAEVESIESDTSAANPFLSPWASDSLPQPTPATNERGHNTQNWLNFCMRLNPMSYQLNLWRAGMALSEAYMEANQQMIKTTQSTAGELVKVWTSGIGRKES